MRKIQHTPGPWTIIGPSPGGTACDDGGDYAIIQDGGVIAEAIHRINQTRYEDALANARLIAAAPELLEKLEEIWEFISQDAIPNWDDPLRDEIISVIAKAKGKAS